MSDLQVPFIKSILHPTDFSAASERALAHALAVALFRKAELTILYVGKDHNEDYAWEQFPSITNILERWNLLEKGSRIEDVFIELGVSIKKAAISGITTTSAISDFLWSDPVDLVVLATEGRDGLSRWLKHSKAESIARKSKAISLFVPADGKSFIQLEDGDLSLKSILIPVDQQLSPKAAVTFATRAAEKLTVDDEQAEITLLHIGDDTKTLDLDLPEGPSWNFRKEIRSGNPVEEIISAANEFSSDAIIMTTAGHEGIFDALRGSTTEQVLRKTNCPLLAVPKSWGT